MTLFAIAAVGVGLKTVDCLLTWWGCTRRGTKEANPILRFFVALLGLRWMLILNELVFCAGIIWLAVRWQDKGYSLALDVLLAGVCAWNLIWALKGKTT